VDFTAFVLQELPPPPARVLEVGSGREGGVVAALAAAGYDALGIDPHAPEGPLYRRISLAELDEGQEFDAVVCGRVLHHVRPLGAAVAKLARLAPLLVVDEFAWERFPGPVTEWYESQHRLLRATGADPPGPPELEEWLARHTDLHPSAVVLAELRARYDERVHEERPYLYRWLAGVATESLEQTLIGAGAIPAIGYFWSGLRRGRR
jgi:SAM-dependent methyltransferase